MIFATKSALTLLLIATNYLANPAFANAEVVEIVRAEAHSAFERLEEKISECLEKKTRKLNPLDIDELQHRHISRTESLTALSYLYQRNSDACGKAERIDFSYSLGVLDSILKEYNVTVPIDIPEAQTLLLYPSHRDYERYLQYMQLDESTREYFEGLVGTEPFNVRDVSNNFPDY
jgi:hypothetical protein